MKVFRALLDAAVVGLVALGVGRVVLGFFTKSSAEYRTRTMRHLRLLAWPLLALGAGLSAAGPGLFSSLPAERGLAWGLLGLVLALAAPALWLHLRYYALNAATTLIFDPRRGQFQVYLGGALAYDPGRQGWPGPAPVEWSRCRWPGVFWRPYEYVRLPLPQGDIFLTSLLMSDLPALVHYLRHFGVVVRERRRVWARV